MNERIRELAEQAASEFTQNFSWEYLPQIDKDIFEKFAELIVRECGEIVSGLIVPETFEQDIGPYEKWNQALGHAALEIEQHFFGVSE